VPYIVTLEEGRILVYNVRWLVFETKTKRRCSVSNRIIKVGVFILAVTLLVGVVAYFTVDVRAQQTYMTYPSKSKGINTSTLSTTGTTLSADTGYMFTHVTICNDDATYNVLFKIGGIPTYNSATEFFIKPGESFTFDCAAVSIGYTASGGSSATDCRIWATEVPKS
jgi:hypothetical protein